MICATSRRVLSNIMPHFADDYRNVSFLTLCHFFFQICIDPSLVWCVGSNDNQTVIRGFCVRYRQNYNYGKVLAGNVYRWLRSDSIKRIETACTCTTFVTMDLVTSCVVSWCIYHVQICKLISHLVMAHSFIKWDPSSWLYLHDSIKHYGSLFSIPWWFLYFMYGIMKYIWQLLCCNTAFADEEEPQNFSRQIIHVHLQVFRFQIKQTPGYHWCPYYYYSRIWFIMLQIVRCLYFVMLCDNGRFDKLWIQSAYEITNKIWKQFSSYLMDWSF